MGRSTNATIFPGQLNDMELEVRGFAAATRRALGNKVRSYKESLDGVQADLSRVKDRHDRESLFSGGSQPLDYNEQSLSQRERLMQTTERMQGTTSRLEEGRRTLAETEDVAMGITSELGRNRETLDEARRKGREVNASTNTARRILRSMQTRELKFKLFIALAILIVLTLIGVVVYYAFIRDKGDR